MPDIKLQIKFTKKQSELIASKLAGLRFTYKNWPDKDLSALRSAIRSFYRNAQYAICAYCRNAVSLRSAGNCHIEHIAPKSKYRQFIFEPKNLCVICADCNEIKKNQETLNEVIDTVKSGLSRKKYPRSSGAFKLVHPHFDDYDQHIKVLGKRYYLDMSKKGNFTIFACNLNRHLHKFGWPPEIADDTKIMAKATELILESDGYKRSKIINALRALILLTD